VAYYLIKELNKLGLETTVQQGYTLSDWGICNQKYSGTNKRTNTENLTTAFAL
jgi:hypothetical protein